MFVICVLLPLNLKIHYVLIFSYGFLCFVNFSSLSFVTRKIIILVRFLLYLFFRLYDFEET